MNQFNMTWPDHIENDVDHPPHYTAGNFETIDVVEDWVNDAPNAVVGGLQWQVIKYISRMWHKGNAYKDARKAQWYLNRLVNKLAAEVYVEN